MSEYKQIHGQTLQTVSSDPSNPLNGQVWFNSTTGKIKAANVVTTGSWSSGGNMNTGRDMLGGAGLQTAALAFGGPDSHSHTEHYDGSAWTNGGNLGTARYNIAGTGTQTAALAFGGGPYGGSKTTEEYNGSSWTAATNLINTRLGSTGTGPQTAALAITAAYGTNVEEYNGSSWTAGGSYPAVITSVGSTGGTGSQTAALGFAGANNYGSGVNNTNHYDGTSWTAGGNYLSNTPEGVTLPEGAGTQTAAVGFGGGPSSNGTKTNQYDGTSWTSSANMSVSKWYHAGAGTQAAGLAFGNLSSPNNITEEYTGAGVFVETISSS